MENHLQPGDTVAGRFRVLKLLGEGGFGEVYLAEQISMKREVALKILHPALCRDPKVIARFEVEARNTSKLKSPNTVIFFDFGRDPEHDVLWLAMEFLEGGDLKDLLEREGPLPPARALHILEQIADSLQEAHDIGMIHRDLKPANVMIVQRGEDADFVKVIDFGIAKIIEGEGSEKDKQLTNTGMLLGTPFYMAPEQVRGKDLDGRVDLYAMAVMTYEMFSGKRPFDGYSALEIVTKHLTDAAPNILELAPTLDVPPTTADFLLRALAKNPEERPATIKDYVKGLRRTLFSDSESTLDSISRSSIEASVRVGQAPLTSHIKPTAVEQPKFTAAAGDRRKMMSIVIGAAAVLMLAVILAFSLGGEEGAGEIAEATPSPEPREAEAAGSESEGSGAGAPPSASAGEGDAAPDEAMEAATEGLLSGAAAALYLPPALSEAEADRAPEAKRRVRDKDKDDEDDPEARVEEKKKRKAEKITCQISANPWGDLRVEGRMIGENRGSFDARRGERLTVQVMRSGTEVAKERFTVPESGDCRRTVRVK